MGFSFFDIEWSKKDILHFADHIQGLDEGILHLEGAILAFSWAIQGFGHPILKFTNSKQFNALENVSVGSPTDTFSISAVIYIKSMGINEVYKSNLIKVLIYIKKINHLFTIAD